MLDLDGIGFAYRPDRWIFRGVSLSLEPGTVTAVLGPNGRGKTTLLRCAAGLLLPLEGSVRHWGPTSFVPQAHESAFAYRALDIVLTGRARHLRPWAAPGRHDREAALAALARVGLADLADQPVTTLSAGERQLVLIARAVASESQVLVLDEPASSLDLRNQGEVLTLLRELAAGGMTVLLSTHHPDHALFAAARAVLIAGPYDVRVGDAEMVLTDGALSALYDVPVQSVHYRVGDTERRVLATRYDRARPARGTTEEGFGHG